MTTPQSSYRHFLYPTGAGAPKLLASASLKPSQAYAGQVVQSNAGYPVDVVPQHEAAAYDGQGAVDLGDLLFALANFLPHKYTTGNRQFSFLWEDGPRRDGYSAAVEYDHMLMYPASGQCYRVDVPTLESMRIELRQQGQSQLTTRWLTKQMRTVSRPATAPQPSPNAQTKTVANNAWQVRYSNDAMNWMALPDVIRAAFDAPRFREGVYTLDGTDSSWSSIAQVPSAPAVTIEMLTNNTFVSSLFGQANELFIELNAGADFRLRCRAKKSAQRLFGLDNGTLMASIDMALIGMWAANAPTEFVGTIIGPPNAQAPTRNSFTILADHVSRFSAGDKIGITEMERTIASIDADGRITLSEDLPAPPPVNDEIMILPAWVRNRYAEILISNTPHSSIV